MDPHSLKEGEGWWDLGQQYLSLSGRLMKPFKAMILAAGLATRLRPLTLSRPKVMIPVQGRPLLHLLVEYLRSGGAENIIVNGHHLSEKLVAYVDSVDFLIPVQVRVEETLLGTGGGIRNVADFWDDRPFVVVNGDILSSIDLQELLSSHERSGAEVTLVLRDEPRFNNVLVAKDGRILSFQGGPGQQLAFTGIQVIEPRVLDNIPADTPISIIDTYLELISTGRKVMAHVVRGQFWRELGTPEGYLEVHREICQMVSAPLPGLAAGGEAVVHQSARLGPGVRLEGMVCIGAGCELENGAVVQGSVIWDQVHIKAGCLVRDCIIGDGVVVTESLEGKVVGSKGRKKIVDLRL